ncbi:MAG: hypothetical protein MK111_25035 [Crocosphaera sp.]|uniref:hypothetical protein n=1 Tax=Crocosphaera TaxID=263510 RepID=UPI0005615F26|nr:MULTISPECIES: hypothetical protein [Crocosphaera]MCH2247854.1 hypothetical protein [Crocosphaera sp.]
MSKNTEPKFLMTIRLLQRGGKITLGNWKNLVMDDQGRIGTELTVNGEEGYIGLLQIPFNEFVGLCEKLDDSELES